MANTKFFRISEIVDRLDKVSAANRHDQVARNIQAVYEKRMEQNPNAFVASDEIRSSYSSFSGLNADSNFRDYFEDIFGDFKTVAHKQTTKAAYDRDDQFVNDNRPMALEIKQDIPSEIRNETLSKVKQVVDAAVSIPEYRYAGFIRMAKAGNTGIANWFVTFHTGTGQATIGVPVSVSDGMAYIPKSFISEAGKYLPFDASTVASYAKNYVGKGRELAFQKSGLVSGTENTLIPTAQMTSQPEPQTTENSSISLSYSIPLDENTSSSIDTVKSNIQESIDKAREVIQKKISENSEGGSVNVNVDINYSGHLDLAEPADYTTDSDEESEEPISSREALIVSPEAEAVSVSPNGGQIMQPFAGIIAFNISKKTINGVRTATVPVLVSPQQATAEFFYGDGQPQALNASSLNAFLSKDTSPSTDDEYQDALTDAFSDSFLTTSATLNELRKMIKSNIYDNKLSLANAGLSAIASKFDEAATKQATIDYINWIKDAKTYSIKRTAGQLTYEDEAKRNKIDLDTVNDPMYSNSAEIHLM